MKIRITVFLALFCLPGAWLRLQAQSKSFKEAFEITLVNAGPIYAKDQVKGYFFFYDMGSAGSGKKKYLTRLLDQNLNIVLEMESVDRVGLALKEAAYNEQLIVLKFLNENKGELHWIGVGKKGEEKFRQTMSAATTELPPNDFSFASIVHRQRTLHDLDSLGFLDFSMDGEELYAIRFFSTSATHKDWTLSPETGKTLAAELLAVQGDTVFAAVYKGRGSWALKSFITAIDLKTGALLFEKEFSEGEMGIAPLQFAVFSGGQSPAFIGWYYRKRAAEFAPFIDKPKNDAGLFLAKVAADGSLFDKKTLSFKHGAFYDSLPKEEGEKYPDLVFHNIVPTAKGEFLVLAETNLWRDAQKMLANELVTIRLSDKFEPAGVKTFGKVKKGGRSIYSVPTFSNLGDWSRSVRFQELGIDYSFTVRGKNGTDFIFGYLADKAEMKGMAGENLRRVGAPDWEFGAMICLGDEVFTDKINLDTSADDVFVFPAKFGYVAIVEYFKKEKKLDLRLEKINY